MVSNDEPASWKLVTPFETASRVARSTTLRNSASTWAGVRRARASASAFSTGDDAVSRRRPVGSPAGVAQDLAARRGGRWRG